MPIKENQKKITTSMRIKVKNRVKMTPTWKRFCELSYLKKINYNKSMLTIIITNKLILPHEKFAMISSNE